MTERLWEIMLQPENERIVGMLNKIQKEKLMTQMLVDTDNQLTKTQVKKNEQ